MFSSRRSRRGNEIATIFVHAGAGFHSVANENVHLMACNDAAKTGMEVLKSGGSAVDAVEMAVRILEDKEITNAGYGSNLAIDGVVECDAVIVDHYGRSGGAGAVAQIKNPVSLARLLLDHTTQTLSLRRVPPNFLAGQGATDFGYEHGMNVLPLEKLVSPSAHDRWRKWKDDLDRAERNKRREEAERFGFSPPPSQSDLTQYYATPGEPEHTRKAHAKAAKASVWNEAQPASPPPSDEIEQREDSISSRQSRSSNSFMTMDTSENSSNTTPDSRDEYSDPYGPPGYLSNASKNPFSNSTQKMPTPPTSGMLHSHRGSDGVYTHEQQQNANMDFDDDNESDTPTYVEAPLSMKHVGRGSGSSGTDSDATTIAHKAHPRSSSSDHPIHSDGGALDDAWTTYDSDLLDEATFDPHDLSKGFPEAGRNTPSLLPPPRLVGNSIDREEDVVTDTVGAIAVDLYGNIACAASSGGIGMKHRGRIGPAALVNIGAAVVPDDPDDSEHVTVATVTSGTGEHMATTNAARLCSDRIYEGVMKTGSGLVQCTEEQAINKFIEKDFMKHPSVQQSHSTGAIGVLSVKKTKDGTYLYYGHNTDSFALASMHSNEMKPVCTMSRNKGSSTIAQGGRSIRNRKRKN